MRGATSLSGTLQAAGSANFAPAVAYGSGGFNAASVAVADVNGEGRLDLVVANGCATITGGFCFPADGAVGVLLGNGDGSFQTAVTYDSGGYLALSVAVADVNGDGKPDLVVANQCVSASNCNNGTVGVLLGNGDGTFQASVSYDSGGAAAESVTVADVNGDGKSDLLVANICPSFDCQSTTAAGVMGVLLGNGDGTFQPVVTYSSGGLYAHSVVVADVNGDRKPDLLVANFDGNNVGVLLGKGDGTFQAALTYGPGGYLALAVAVADVNGDGKPDLAVANQCASATNCNNGAVGVLLGNGDGTFRTAVSYGSGGIDAASVTVGDINGDGKLDLVVANDCGGSSNCGTVGVLLGNGDGTFQAAVTYGSGGAAADSVVVADVNGDGKSDLLVSNYCASSCNNHPEGNVGVLINQTVPDFVLLANPATLTISAPGQRASTTITITTYGNLNAQSLTNWSCSGLPSESTCTFGTVDSNQQLGLSITTTAASDLRWPLFGHDRRLFYALLLPGLLGVSMSGRRYRLRGLRQLALILVLGLPALWLACGGGSGGTTTANSGTPTGSSTVTISATSGTLQHSTNITLAVQ